MNIEKNLIYPKYIYLVYYYSNCEETNIVYLSLSKKRCIYFISSHTCSNFREYWNYHGSRIMYKPDSLTLKRIKLDSFRQIR